MAVANFLRRNAAEAVHLYFRPMRWLAAWALYLAGELWRGVRHEG